MLAVIPFPCLMLGVESHIQPADPVKMSSPFSYFYFTFASNDGKSHNVQLYSDISGGMYRVLHLLLFSLCKYSIHFLINIPFVLEWISGDTRLNMTWTGSDDGTLTLLQANLLISEPFQINGETCQDGVISWAMNSVRNLSSETTVHANNIMVYSPYRAMQRAGRFLAQITCGPNLLTVHPYQTASTQIFAPSQSKHFHFRRCWTIINNILVIRSRLSPLLSILGL